MLTIEMRYFTLIPNRGYLVVFLKSLPKINNITCGLWYVHVTSYTISMCDLFADPGWGNMIWVRYELLVQVKFCKGPDMIWAVFGLHSNCYQNSTIYIAYTLSIQGNQKLCFVFVNPKNKLFQMSQFCFNYFKENRKKNCVAIFALTK